MSNNSVLNEKIETVSFLINKITEKSKGSEVPSHALLIGAGCSASCNIPLGTQIIKLCQIHSFIIRINNSLEFLSQCKNKFDVAELEEVLNKKKLYKQYQEYIIELTALLNEKIEKDKEVHLKHLTLMLDVDKTAIHWKEYQPLIFADNQYGFWMDKYSEDPRKRQEFIEQIIENKSPNGAYIFLSYLMQKKIFTNVLTTNFDDLINEALTYYTDVRCRFYADDELSQFISIYSNKPNLIKLHGDYRFANIKNTLDETEQLSKNLKAKFEELLSQLGLIIIGYNGADHSIMSVLYEIKKKWKFSLLWCGKDPNNVHWRVAQLINNTSNSYFIKIESFDSLIGQLAAFFLSDEPSNDLISSSEQKMKEIRKFLNQFIINFKKSDASNNEKEKLEQAIDKWDVLRQANESTIDDKKLRLYTEFIKQDDKVPGVFKNRGFIYKKFHEYEKAIKDYNTAIRLAQNEEDVEAELHFLRAEVYLDLKKYKIAKRDCDKAIQFDKKNMYAFNNRGFAFLFLKEYKKAIDDFNEALKLDKNYKNPYCHLSIAYAKTHDYAKALDSVNKALDLDKSYGRAFFNRSEVYKLLKKKNEAMQDLKKAKKLLSDEFLEEQYALWKLH